MMRQLKRKIKQSDVKHEAGAKRAVLEELFSDMYDDRRRVYRVNFVRGIFFGIGSALGGTVVIAVSVWLLSLFVNMPLVGDLFQDAQQSIERRTNSAD